MFKSLANMLRKKPVETPPANSANGPNGAARPDDASIYESLAMTEELREALFPTTPQMVSAIFERPLPHLKEPPPPPAPPPTDVGNFPLLF